MATTPTRAPLAAYNQRAAEYAQDTRAFQHWRDELVRALPLRPGDTVVDVGCGSGLCLAGLRVKVGPTGHVVGVDFTTEQLAKARRLATETGVAQIEFREGRIEALPVADAVADYVISNGVINLCPDKATVFAEAARVLRPGGMLAIADIVTERPLTEAIVCNADLWASCIGGAPQKDTYLGLIEAAGFTVERVRANPYAFLSAQARNASLSYGVKSISVLASKGF